MFERFQKLVTVGIRLFIDSEEGEPDFLTAELVVDEKPLSASEHGPLDLVELASSLENSGDFFIWTCECGCPGCAGRFKGVSVSHNNGLTRWFDRDLKRRYFFELDKLRQRLERARDDARELLTRRPGLQWAPESNHTFTDVA